MAEYKLVLPPMGEGIIEATLTQWIKNEGDDIKEDDTVIEIATDKVDSDVPSPVSGKLIKKLKSVNDICKIGEAFAILEIEDDLNSEQKSRISSLATEKTEVTIEPSVVKELEQPLQDIKKESISLSTQNQFYSPLVRAICKEENISLQELESIKGSGLSGRVTKEDVLNYLKNRTSDLATTTIEDKTSLLGQEEPEKQSTSKITLPLSSIPLTTTTTFQNLEEGNEIIEMDRTRRLIAEYMLKSKQISPHVTSFVETDVTNVVLWRDKYKGIFLKKHESKLTFMPVFVQAIIKAIKDFPMINISVEGDTIIKKKNINIGIATALPNGNLIVPVIKNADLLSLSGLAISINNLAEKARTSKLKPDDIKGGTYTISNIGSFGNIAGTPIINQPEVAIMAVGSIVKKPAVIETPQGDLIGIRHKMILSHTFDHRVIDGALGGAFAKKVSDYLENFDLNTEI